MKAMASILIFFFATLLYGQTFSISTNIGIENYTIPSVKQNFNLLDGTPSFIEREEVSNPLNAGLQIRYEKNKMIFGIDADIAYKEYNVRYGNLSALSLPPFSTDTLFSSDYSVPWVRVGLNLIILYNILDVNSFKINAGFGGGLQAVAPVVSETFLRNTLLKKFETLDVSTDVSPEYLGNGKIIAEALYSFTKSISVGVEGSYLLLSKGKNEQPENFVVLKTKLLISF